MESVTVDEAIKKGRKQLSYTPVFILFVLLAISMVGVYLIENDTIWMPIWGFSSFGCAFVLPLVYYFIMLPRWRIWAFSNVRNVHELKDRAKLANIYPKDGSFLWRLEIKNATQKAQLAELGNKFEQPDVFIDDLSIPFETQYAYSQVLNFFYLLFTISGIVCFVVFLNGGEIFISLLLFAGCIFLGRMTYKRYKQKEPVLIISNDGITVNNDGLISKDEGFYPWKDVTNERVFWVSAGRASKYVFAFDASGVSKKMDLRELTGLSSYKIDHVLRTYRGRYEASILQNRRVS
jgi:hypothetical protein